MRKIELETLEGYKKMLELVNVPGPDIEFLLRQYYNSPYLGRTIKYSVILSLTFSGLDNSFPDIYTSAYKYAADIIAAIIQEETKPTKLEFPYHLY